MGYKINLFTNDKLALRHTIFFLKYFDSEIVLIL